jgi:hypothetical protein
MAFKAVIGEDPAQIRMAGEQDAIQIVGFALEPVGARIDLTSAMAPERPRWLRP